MTKKESLQAPETQDEKPTEAELKKLQSELARLKSENEAKTALLQKYETKNVGTLIICPNPLADFRMFGIRFVDGCAFLPDTQPIAYFEVTEPMPSDTILWRETLELFADAKFSDMPMEEKKKYFEKTKQELIASRARTSASRAASFLTNDFGYTAVRYGQDQQEELEKFLHERHTLRTNLEEKRKASSKTSGVYDKLSTAQYLEQIITGG